MHQKATIRFHWIAFPSADISYLAWPAATGPSRHDCQDASGADSFLMELPLPSVPRASDARRGPTRNRGLSKRFNHVVK